MSEIFKDREQHESYGLMGFYRVQHSCPVNLVGSSIQSTNTIRMRIKTAYKTRDLSTDHYYGDKNIIEVEMSANQFYDIISNMNYADGFPVTIKYIDGREVEEPPIATTRSDFDRDIEDNIKKATESITAAIDRVTTLLENKKSVTKGDREEIISLLENASRGLISNNKFVVSQFEKRMDKSVREAQAEVESFITNKVQSLGIEALKVDSLLKLTTNNDEEGE